MFKWRNNTWDNDTQHNDNQHKGRICEFKQNDTQYARPWP